MWKAVVLKQLLPQSWKGDLGQAAVCSMRQVARGPPETPFTHGCLQKRRAEASVNASLVHLSTAARVSSLRGSERLSRLFPHKENWGRGGSKRLFSPLEFCVPFLDLRGEEGKGGAREN